MPGHVLHVRLSAAELRAVDGFASAHGASRSAAVRRLLRAGLAAEGAPDAPAPVLESWEVTARRLEEQSPERWALPDDPLDAFTAARLAFPGSGTT